MKNRFGGSSYTLDTSNTKILNNVGDWLQADYETTNGIGNDSGDGVENCTLSSLTNIMLYFNALGYTKVPSDHISLYKTIRAEAVKLEYSNTGGISNTKNNNLVDATWKALGYTDGNGTNDYAWTFNSIKSKININRPVMFSLASSPYYDHTIAVCGYNNYKNGSSNYSFLVVHDNWNYGNRYLSDTEGYFGCATYIYTPTTK